MAARRAITARATVDALRTGSRSRACGRPRRRGDPAPAAQCREQLSVQSGLHLRRDRAVAHILTGWAGQVSLGQFGLVAVGALIAAHLGLVCPVAAAAALRRRRHRRGGHRRRASRAAPAGAFPRGDHPGLCHLHAGGGAGHAVLDLAGLHKTLCTGLPNPASTLIGRPSLFGLGCIRSALSPGSPWASSCSRSSRYGSGGTKGVARRLIAVVTTSSARRPWAFPCCGPSCWPSVSRGSWPATPGACLAFATQRFSTATFDPTVSFIIISMVVIGGLGSVRGGGARCAVSRGPSGALRGQPDHSIPDQWPRADRLHPLPSRRPG